MGCMGPRRYQVSKPPGPHTGRGAQGDGQKRRELQRAARHPRESRLSHALQGSRRAARSSSRRLQTVWTAGRGPRSRHVIAVPVADACPRGTGWQGGTGMAGSGSPGRAGPPHWGQVSANPAWPVRRPQATAPRPSPACPASRSTGQGGRTAPCALTARLVILPSELARVARNVITPGTDAANTRFSKQSPKCNCGRMLRVALLGLEPGAAWGDPQIGRAAPPPWASRRLALLLVGSSSCGTSVSLSGLAPSSPFWMPLDPRDRPPSGDPGMFSRFRLLQLFYRASAPATRFS